MLRNVSSHTILQMLIADGWYESSRFGEHYLMLHPQKKEAIFLKHPVEKLPPKMLDCICSQSGLTIK